MDFVNFPFFYIIVCLTAIKLGTFITGNTSYSVLKFFRAFVDYNIMIRQFFAWPSDSLTFYNKKAEVLSG